MGKKTLSQEIKDLTDEMEKITEELTQRGITIRMGYRGQHSESSHNTIFCHRICSPYVATSHYVKGKYVEMSKKEKEEATTKIRIETANKCQCRRAIAIIKEIGEPLTPKQLWG